MSRLLLSIFSLLIVSFIYPPNLFPQSVEPLLNSSEIVCQQTEETSSVFADQSTEEWEELDDFETLYPRSKSNPYKFHVKEIIVPASLITLGSLGLTSWAKKHINQPVRDALQGNGHKKFGIDNITLWLPAAAGYGMNLFGFKGKHNIADATILYATAFILVEATNLTLKHTIHSERPNHKNNLSFPSGHTQIAFCGAELLRREYWDVSPWIGVGGYVVAAATGFMRLYNNAHWLNDVVAGAGLGILCAEAAYWLYPVITKTFFKKRYDANIFLSPAVSTNHLGLSLAIDL